MLNLAERYSDDLRAVFPCDPPALEFGVEPITQREISVHMGTAPRIRLTHDPLRNFQIWLQARNNGDVLMKANGNVHEAAQYLVRMFLAFKKHADKHGAILDRNKRSFEVEREFLTAFFGISDGADVMVTVPPPYVDHTLKTDAILDFSVPPHGARRIGVQVTTNPNERQHKFEQIHRAY